MKELKTKYRLFISILIIAIIYIFLIAHFSNNMLKLELEKKSIEIDSLKNDVDIYSRELRIYENAKGMEE